MPTSPDNPAPGSPAPGSTTGLAYHIPKWQDRHANDAQRRSGGRWIACPASFDSLGYALLMSEPEGPATFGVYITIAECAARSPMPGVLLNQDGRPLTLVEVALITRVPLAAVRAAVARLLRPDLGWLSQITTPDAPDHPPEPPEAAEPPHSSFGTRHSDFGPSPSHPPSGPPPEPVRSASGTAPDTLRNDSVSRVRTASQPPPVRNSSSAGWQAGRLAARMGVPSRLVGEIAQTGISPADLVACWAEIAADPRVRRPGLVLHRRVAQDGAAGHPQLTAAALVKALRGGIVAYVQGVPAAQVTVRTSEWTWTDPGKPRDPCLRPAGVYQGGRLLAPLNALGALDLDTQPPPGAALPGAASGSEPAPAQALVEQETP